MAEKLFPLSANIDSSHSFVSVNIVTKIEKKIIFMLSIILIARYSTV